MANKKGIYIFSLIDIIKTIFIESSYIKIIVKIHATTALKGK